MASTAGKNNNEKVVNTDTSTFYDGIKNLKKLCGFLQTGQGLELSEATEHGKNVDFFKGEKLVSFLVKEKKGAIWPTELPRIKTRDEAITLCKNLCHNQLIRRMDKIGVNELEVSNDTNFDETGYFIWVCQSRKITDNITIGGFKLKTVDGFTLKTIGVILFLLSFPYWPKQIKVLIAIMICTPFFLFLLTYWREIPQMVLITKSFMEFVFSCFKWLFSIREDLIATAELVHEAKIENLEKKEKKEKKKKYGLFKRLK